MDDNNAINASKGIKLGAGGNENGVKVASNAGADQIHKLMSIIKSNPEATQAQYAAELGISKRTISRMFASLQEQGVLEQRGTKRKVKWSIIDKR